jgi:hypothetical protein
MWQLRQQRGFSKVDSTAAGRFAGFPLSEFDGSRRKSRDEISARDEFADNERR